jgi:hypothetical protein
VFHRAAKRLGKRRIVRPRTKRARQLVDSAADLSIDTTQRAARRLRPPVRPSRERFHVSAKVLVKCEKCGHGVMICYRRLTRPLRHEKNASQGRRGGDRDGNPRP